MNTFQHFDSCPLQNSNWGRGGIFYHFMANTLATQDLLQNEQDFTIFTTWAQLKVERCVWNTRRGMGGGEVNCWIMLALEGQGCSYSALGCEHQEHTERESNNKSEPIKYSQPAQIPQKNIFHFQVCAIFRSTHKLHLLYFISQWTPCTLKQFIFMEYSIKYYLPLSSLQSIYFNSSHIHWCPFWPLNEKPGCND